MLLDKYFSRDRKKVLNETPYFKDAYLRYYTKDLTGGVREFWAYPVSGFGARDYGWELEKYGVDGAFYLGSFIKEELTKPENFMSLPMPLQRGALRLYREVGIYYKI